MKTASLLLLLLAAAPVAAQQTQRDVRIAGMGARSCADWNGWKEARDAQPRALALEWTQGFIAGHNVYARPRPPATTVYADTKVLLPLIDAYCQKNPEMRLISVVIEITRNLGGTSVQIKPRPPGTPPPTPGRESSS